MAGDRYDNPNQDVVRGNPPSAGGDGGFDPADHTVDEVKAYVGEHPDEADRVNRAEQEGKARATLIGWLDDFDTEETVTTTPQDPNQPDPNQPQPQPDPDQPDQPDQ